MVRGVSDKCLLMSLLVACSRYHLRVLVTKLQLGNVCPSSSGFAEYRHHFVIPGQYNRMRPIRGIHNSSFPVFSKVSNSSINPIVTTYLPRPSAGRSGLSPQRQPVARADARG